MKKDNLYFLLVSLLTLSTVLVLLDIAVHQSDGPARQAAALLNEQPAVLVAQRYENALSIFSADSLTSGGAIQTTYKGGALAEKTDHAGSEDITDMDYCPTRSEAAVLSAKNDELYLVSLTQAKLTNRIEVGSNPVCVRYNPVGSELWVSYANESYLEVFDIEAMKTIAKIQLPTVCSEMLFSYDGLSLYAAAQGKNCLYRIDAEHKALVQEIPSAGQATSGMALFGQEVWAVHPDTGEVTRLSPEGKPIEYFTAGPCVWDIACAGGCAYITVPGENKLKVYQLGDDKDAVLSAETQISGRIGAVLTDTLHSRLMVASELNNTVEVYSLPELTHLQSIPVGAYPIDLALTEVQVPLEKEKVPIY